MVLIKKTLAVLVTLFTTFRPSITTCGRLVKSESSSTTWRDLAAGIASVRHGDGAVRLPQRQKIIDSVSRHGYLVSLSFQRTHQFLFLSRRHSRKHRVLLADLLIINVLSERR